MSWGAASGTGTPFVPWLSDSEGISGRAARGGRGELRVLSLTMGRDASAAHRVWLVNRLGPPFRSRPVVGWTWRSSITLGVSR
jgi:hypothetical protein